MVRASLVLYRRYFFPEAELGTVTWEWISCTGSTRDTFLSKQDVVWTVHDCSNR